VVSQVVEKQAAKVASEESHQVTAVVNQPQDVASQPVKAGLVNIS